LPDYRAESCAVKQPEDIKQVWIELQQRTDCSYFQSWGWVGSWLEHVVSDLDPLLLKVWHGDVLVGAGIFVPGEIVRHHFLHSKVMFLNEYPLDGRNMVIEFNGLLADRKHKQAVHKKISCYLLETFKSCDEFLFSALDKSEDCEFLEEYSNTDKSNLIVLEESRAWSVDMAVFGYGVDAFLETLSKNRRAQIRRSIKLYEEHAPVVLDEAGNVEEAQLFFDGLKQLHTERWESKGSAGSFANPVWENFHRALINERFSSDEVQLLRVSNAAGVIGYAYNFIWRGHVYVLQTGFGVVDDKRLMPGYVMHVLAIAHNKQKGMAVYDLMYGDSLYKKILCNQSQPLYWLVIQRKQFRFFLETAARKTVRWLRYKLA
jgi:CelD/BcsL family acetyltransferase involved in cellulose biosynthesis